MSTLITGATSWLATYLIQSTLLLLGALALARWLREPAARERVWKIALVAPLFTASAGFLLPSGARPVLDLSPRLQAGVVPDPAAPPPADVQRSTGTTMTTMIVNPNAPAASSVPVAPTREPDRAPVVVAPPRNWLGLTAVALWLAGAGLLLSRRALALRRLRARLASRRVVRKGVAHDLLAELCGDDELSVRLRLTLADQLSTPLVLAPGEICLPRRVAEELPERELAAILAHEVAHVRRGDLLWLRGCALLECLLFAQPLNRLARQRMSEDAELLCDDWAGERTGARLELAQGLETVARWSRSPQRPLPLPCLGNERGVLLRRVERLLAEPAARRRTVALTAGLALVVAGLACVGPAVKTGAKDGPPDVDALDTDALLALCRQVSARSSERLMALPDDWQHRYAEPLAVQGSKAVRLLQRDSHDLAHEIPPKRGGGSYYSFVTDDTDYNREPDISYEGNELSTGFYGNSTGHVLDIGPVKLSAIGPDKPPEGVPSDVARLYSAMTGFTATGDDVYNAFRGALGITYIGRTGVVAGDSYLLRAILPDEHDILAAFTVVDVRPGSLVLVGRVIKTWPVRGERRDSSPRVDWSTADAPSWLLALDDSSLFALRSSLQTTLGNRLLAVPPSATSATGAVGMDAGVARLLQRGRYEGLTNVRGDGAYFSFVTRSNSYDHEPDLEWQQRDFNTGFYGSNGGDFLDLGDAPLEAIDLAKPPSGLSADRLAEWNSLQAPKLSQGSDRVHASIGNTYLLRSVLADEHDVLAAFRPVQQDEHGMTIAWRVLKLFPH